MKPTKISPKKINRWAAQLRSMVDQLDEQIDLLEKYYANRSVEWRDSEAADVVVDRIDRYENLKDDLHDTWESLKYFQS